MGRISYEGKRRCLAGSYVKVTNETFQDYTGRYPTGKRIPRGGILREGKDLLETLLDWQDSLFDLREATRFYGSDACKVGSVERRQDALHGREPQVIKLGNSVASTDEAGPHSPLGQ